MEEQPDHSLPSQQLRPPQSTRRQSSSFSHVQAPFSINTERVVNTSFLSDVHQQDSSYGSLPQYPTSSPALASLASALRLRRRWLGLATPLGGSLGEMLGTPRGSGEGVLASAVYRSPFRPSSSPLAAVSLSQAQPSLLRRRARAPGGPGCLGFRCRLGRAEPTDGRDPARSFTSACRFKLGC